MATAPSTETSCYLCWRSGRCNSARTGPSHGMGSPGRAQPVPPGRSAVSSPRPASPQCRSVAPSPALCGPAPQEIALDKELLSLQEAKKKRVAPRPATHATSPHHAASPLTLPRPCVCPGSCSCCTTECICIRLHTRTLPTRYTPPHALSRCPRVSLAAAPLWGVRRFSTQ